MFAIFRTNHSYCFLGLRKGNSRNSLLEYSCFVDLRMIDGNAAVIVGLFIHTQHGVLCKLTGDSLYVQYYTTAIYFMPESLIFVPVSRSHFVISYAC